MIKTKKPKVKTPKKGVPDQNSRKTTKCPRGSTNKGRCQHCRERHK